MPDCRYCQQSFEEETDYRNHLYHAHDREELGRIDERRVEQSLDTLTDTTTTVLDNYLQRDPTNDILHHAVETYAHLLWKTLEWEDFETLRGLFWMYYEPLVTSLDTVVKAEGWSVLTELIDAYDPRTESPPPGLNSVIANVVGRYVIRVRVSDGVESIPVQALKYLQVFADREHPFEQHQPLVMDEPSPGYLEWEASYAYGWGIGHSDHGVADRIHEVARSSEPEWGQASLKQAFYADQYEAAKLLEHILDDPAVDYRLFILKAVPVDETKLTIHTPYWNWRDDVPSQFELDSEVVTRLQNHVIDSNLVMEVPDGWPLKDE